MNYVECKSNLQVGQTLNKGRFYMNYVECKSNLQVGQTLNKGRFYMNYVECKSCETKNASDTACFI